MPIYNAGYGTSVSKGGGGGYGGGGYATPYRMPTGNRAFGSVNAYRASRGGGSAAGGGGAQTPQMPYQPQGPNVQSLIDPLAEAGKGLLDPDSAYSQRMRSELSEDIGAQSEAQQRAAALRAAQAGLGGGASPELLETQGDIGRAGLEAYGDAASNALLGGMQLGGQMLNPAISGQLGLQGQQLQGYLAQQQGLQNQEQMRWQQAMEQQRMQQELMMQQLAMAYGGF